MMQKHRFAIALFCMFVCAAWTLRVKSRCYAQSVDQPAQSSIKRFPYQRVFVPSSDLDLLEKDDLRAIEVARLEELLGKYERSNRTNFDNQNEVDNQGPVELVSSFYSAKLVGADLLSDRSRIAFSGEFRSDMSVGLRPWSLAVQTPNAAGAKSEADDSLRWSFDGLGMPRIALMPNFQDTIQGVKRPLSLWTQFGWSLKSLPESTTNKLKFSFDVPKCANSCLILALPPQALVDDCSTVVTRVEDWATIDKRVSDWKDFSQGRSREQTLPRATESLWLIELGGSASASFSISLSNGNRAKEDLATSDFQPYKHLVASQTVEHFIEEQLIRTTCESNVFVAPNQILRINVPTDSRIRRLTVNQQEIDWGIEDGWIQWRRSNSIAATSRSDSISLEFFTPLPIDKLTHLEMPRVAFDRSYVMSGSNVVHCDSFWKMTHCECESAQVVEASTEPRSNGVTRVEHLWYASPPIQTIGLSRVKLERRSEVLTRFSNDANGVNALVRVRLNFNEQDMSQASLKIDPKWSVKSVQSLDPNDGLSVDSKLDSNGSPTELRFTWGRIQKSRVADIELRLRSEIHSEMQSEKDRDIDRETGHASTSNRRIEGRHVFQLPGWRRSDTIIVENSSSFDFRLKEPLLDALTSDESLVDWQKVYLPKSNKHYVFRIEEPISDGQVLFLPNAKLDSTKLDSMACLANPPELEWRAIPNPLKAKVSTEVGWANSTELSIHHQLQLELGSEPDEWISIGLPSEFVDWRIKENGKWVAIEPRKTNADADSDASVWSFKSKSLGTECMLMAIVRSELSGDREVAIRLPEVINAEVKEQVVRSVTANIAIHDLAGSNYWSIDESGAKVLTIATAPRAKPPALVAKADNSNQPTKWVGLTSQLHVAVDALGKQKASLELHTVTSVQGTIEIDLDDGWEPQSVEQIVSASGHSIPFRMESGRLVISPKADMEGDRRFRVEFVGPRLHKKFCFTTWSNDFAFQLPRIGPNRDCIEQNFCLWLPKELQVEGKSHRSLASDAGYWPVWKGARSVAGSVLSSLQFQTVAEETPSSADINRLLPEWATMGWYLAIHDTSTSEFVDSSQPVMIVSRSSGRVILALFFALFTLVTPRLISSKYPFAFGSAIFLIVCIHFGPPFSVPVSYASLVGMSVGFVAMVLYSLVSKSKTGDGSVSHKNSGKLSAWDDRGADSGSVVPQVDPAMQSAPPFGAIGICLAACWLATGESSLVAAIAQGKSGHSNAQEPVYQVVIPMDGEGNMVGTSVYVPSEMLDELNGKTRRTQSTDRSTQTTAARYALRLGTRGRGFGVTDQLTMVYEFQVGEDLEAVRFPVNVTQLQFPRFSVDGVELSLGVRLRSNGSEWIWTPDKPGRRVVTIVAQPILKTNDTDRNRESIVQALDIAVLPMANAQIEIETDSQSTAEVVSKGRVTDPAAGRYVAMLGPVERLQCTVTTPLSKASTFSNPSANQVESSEVPIMNTELFMQGDLLQARTVVEFSKGVSIGQEIEIEADSQWTPVGTNWGDAEWIETRPGSTLGRRRYLLEWKGNSGNLPPVASRDRQITVLWIPQSSSTILNVLFAECRDRRTRRGTLRYSRIDSNWNLEGVSTWIPAIGPRDRLDWPEMKINPIATSLRIPSSGGFGGVLKHKLRTERAQARITTKWNIQSNRETLTSIVELRGSVSSSEAFYLELPREFSVTELSNGNGPIRYLQSTNNGKLRLQVLADRKTLEVSNLIIQARRNDLGRHSRTAIDNEWSELPWVLLPNNINADQSLEVTASESVAIRLEVEPNVILGRGQNVPTLNFSKSNSELHSSVLVASKYQIIDRNIPVVGQLTIRMNPFNPLANQREIEVLGTFSQSTLSRPSFVLEVPASLKDRLQSELKIRNIPCPDPRKAWLQIQLPENQKSTSEGFNNNNDKSLISIVRFSPKIDELTNEDEWMRNIVALDDEFTTVYELNSESGSQKELAAISADKKNRQDSTAPWLTHWSLSIRDLHLQSSSAERFVLVESEFWIAGASVEAHGERTLEWQFSDDSELLSIAVNGVTVDSKSQGQLVGCTIAQAGLCANVVVYSKHRISNDGIGNGIVTAPKLLGAPSSTRPIFLNAVDELSRDDQGGSGNLPLGAAIGIALDGIPLVATPQNQKIGAMAQLCLDMIESSLEVLSNASQLEPTSYAGHWRNFWFQKSHRIIETWASLPDTEDQETYGSVVNRWHSILDQESIEKPVDRIGISNSKRSEAERAFTVPNAVGYRSWYSFVGSLFVLISLQQLVRLRAWFIKRPWWCLLALGVFVWIVFGTVIPALVLGGIGLAVAADSYWIVTSRLRRTGTRGLPSL